MHPSSHKINFSKPTEIKSPATAHGPAAARRSSGFPASADVSSQAHGNTPSIFRNDLLNRLRMPILRYHE